MICIPCKNAGSHQLAPKAGLKNTEQARRRIAREELHKKCKGGTWCDCQHRVDRKKAI